MADLPNVAHLRRQAQAFEKGDMKTVADSFADNIVWHFPGKSQVAGEYEGKAAVLAFLGKAFELTGGTFRFELIDLMGSEKHVAQMDRVTATRNGKKLDIIEVLVFQVEGGKTVEVWHRTDPALHEFFS